MRRGIPKVKRATSFLARPKPLPRSFYMPTARHVAPGLLGHWLIRKTPAGWCGGVIVETEAYLVDDPACHGFRGESGRNRAMFGPPGFAYVYLIYGIHYCFNTVCGPRGTAEAVLVRAIEADFARDEMRDRRGLVPERNLTSGPAKLCAALGIDRQWDGRDLCDSRSDLMVAANPERDMVMGVLGPVVVTERIGITRAADWPLRFYLDRSEFISRKARIP